MYMHIYSSRPGTHRGTCHQPLALRRSVAWRPVGVNPSEKGSVGLTLRVNPAETHIYIICIYIPPDPAHRATRHQLLALCSSVV